ncbi:RidA family protein [Enterobacter cloacae subsp. cloacae]|nr:RidA family protein [Enterobacter cloacae subsp. cloacae]
MTAREAVFPQRRRALYERNRYSPAIKSNGFLFVSGQVGSREDGSPEPDSRAVRLAFTNLLLPSFAAAGRTSDDVADVTFVVDPESNLDAIWSILPEYWGKRFNLTLTDRRMWLQWTRLRLQVIAAALTVRAFRHRQIFRTHKAKPASKAGFSNLAPLGLDSNQ